MQEGRLHLSGRTGTGHLGADGKLIVEYEVKASATDRRSSAGEDLLRAARFRAVHVDGMIYGDKVFKV